MNEAFVRIQCRWMLTWSTNRLRFLFHSWVIYDKTSQFLFSKENLGIWLTHRHSLHSITQMLTKFQAIACRGLGEQWFSPARINDFPWNNSSRIILHKIAANLGFERQWNIKTNFPFTQIQIPWERKSERNRSRVSARWKDIKFCMIITGHFLNGSFEKKPELWHSGDFHSKKMTFDFDLSGNRLFLIRTC